MALANCTGQSQMGNALTFYMAEIMQKSIFLQFLSLIVLPLLLGASEVYERAHHPPLPP